MSSPIRHFNLHFNEPPPKSFLSSAHPPDLRANLAAHSNVSDSACFQRGVDALSIIIRGFAESWGLGNMPGCVKVSMRKASSCLQKQRWWTEILRKARVAFLLPGGLKEEWRTNNNSVFSLRKQAWESFKCTNLELRRKQSQGKLP